MKEGVWAHLSDREAGAGVGSFLSVLSIPTVDCKARNWEILFVWVPRISVGYHISRPGISLGPYNPLK